MYEPGRGANHLHDAVCRCGRAGEWLAPKFVYRMGSRQAAETSDAARVAYLAAFKKSVASLAWGSFAWCFSEPDHLIAFDGATPWAIRSLRYFGGGGPGR